jgi:hypothetical protein
MNVQEINYEDLLRHVKEDKNITYINVNNVNGWIFRYIFITYKVELSQNKIKNIIQILCDLDPDLWKLLLDRYWDKNPPMGARSAAKKRNQYKALKYDRS